MTDIMGVLEEATGSIKLYLMKALQANAALTEDQLSGFLWEALDPVLKAVLEAAEEVLVGLGDTPGGGLLPALLQAVGPSLDKMAAKGGDKKGADRVITLTKIAGMKIGVHHYPEDNTIEVGGEKGDGTLVNKWNEENPSCKVDVGSRVVNVNGIESAEGMLYELRTQSVLCMRFCEDQGEMKRVQRDRRLEELSEERSADNARRAALGPVEETWTTRIKLGEQSGGAGIVGVYLTLVPRVELQLLAITIFMETGATKLYMAPGGSSEFNAAAWTEVASVENEEKCLDIWGFSSPSRVEITLPAAVVLQADQAYEFLVHFVGEEGGMIISKSIHEKRKYVDHELLEVHGCRGGLERGPPFTESLCHSPRHHQPYYELLGQLHVCAVVYLPLQLEAAVGDDGHLAITCCNMQGRMLAELKEVDPKEELAWLVAHIRETIPAAPGSQWQVVVNGAIASELEPQSLADLFCL